MSDTEYQQKPLLHLPYCVAARVVGVPEGHTILLSEHYLKYAGLLGSWHASSEFLYNTIIVNYRAHSRQRLRN